MQSTLKKIIFISLITFFQLPEVTAQETDFYKEYNPIWKSAKEVTIELAKAMPDSLYDYRPTPKMRSFKEQMLHIGHTITWMYEYIINANRDDLPQQPKGDMLSKKDVIIYLEEQFNEGEKLLRSLTEEDLKRDVDYFHYGKINLKYGFISIQDHLVNHRSKANLYFRLNGLKPPEYTYLKK